MTDKPLTRQKGVIIIMPNRIMRIVVYILLISLLITTVLSGIGWIFS